MVADDDKINQPRNWGNNSLEFATSYWWFGNPWYSMILAMNTLSVREKVTVFLLTFRKAQWINISRNVKTTDPLACDFCWLSLNVTRTIVVFPQLHSDQQAEFPGYGTFLPHCTGSCIIRMTGCTYAIHYWIVTLVKQKQLCRHGLASGI